MASGFPVATFQTALAVCLLCGAAAAVEERGPARFEKAERVLGSLRALHRARRVPVLSDVPQHDPRAGNAPQDAPSGGEVESISRSFHLYALSRPNTLVFRQRYLAPDEAPWVELEELRAAAGDLNRLFGPLAAGWNLKDETRDHDGFYESLTTAQRAAMRSKILPLVSLSREQQALWETINRTHAFGHEGLFVGAADSALSGWARAELAYRTETVVGSGGVKELLKLLWFVYTQPAAGQGTGPINLPPAIPSPPSVDVGAMPAGEELPALPPLPRSLSARIQVADEVMSLGALMEKISIATGSRIEIPAYATNRRLIACCSDSRASDVLRALEDLYGWSLQRSRARWYLQRPPVPIVNGPVQTYQAARAALPPPFRHLWTQESRPSRTARENVQRAFIYSEIAAQRGKDWQRIGCNEMSAAAQRCLANYLFDAFVRQSRAAKPSLPAYVADTSNGFFVLTGPEDHPTLTFRVQRADGKDDVWGWVIGTSIIGN
jgi:hypothetical protein